MNETKNNNVKKCNFKCSICHNYDRESDCCYEKRITNCSKQPPTEFSQCDMYLVREDLCMF